MKKSSKIMLMLTVGIAQGLLLLTAGVHAAIIIDHTCTNLPQVPASYINQAKAQLKIWYGHTSHGSQITSGIENLQSYIGEPYTFNPEGSGGALSYQEEGGDLGYAGDFAWESTTRDKLNESGNDRNMIMWSWCGGVSENTEEGINGYLNAMNQLELDYPNVQFVYMTGHLDGSGEGGNLNVRNNQIRQYCLAHNKILFDFADIESYDPDGSYFLNRGADDGCYYDSGNWAEEWCGAHSSSDLCWSCDCQHSHPLNCNLKGRAFWWMLARIMGWSGTGPNPTATPLQSPTPTPQETPECTPTPWSGCTETGVVVTMPFHYYAPGIYCRLDAMICSMESNVLYDIPLYVVLDVFGFYYIGPDFTNDLPWYITVQPGGEEINIIPEFYWPEGVGAASNLWFYAAMTNAEVTDLFGGMSNWEFSYGE